MSRIRLKYVSVLVASASGVADRWASQYQHPKDGWGSGKIAGGKTRLQIYEELCALGPTPSIEDTAKVIGNQSWSYLSCNGCADYVVKAAALGEYDPKIYCETCLTEALSALKS